jgi:hypothetical protein
MYLIDDMIEMGLKDGQKWPTKAHRNVAINLALGNPLICTRDALTGVVQKVCAIPEKDIKTLRWTDLPKYDLALVCAG